MGTVTTIGLDIAKSVFQVHGVDAAGGVVLRQRLTRSRMLKFFAKLPSCLIGIEACASSHYWARELVALGHDVRLMPAQYVKPYVKCSKNDAADAEAICEAVTRPTMRFVGIKSPEQQSAMMLHRVRLILSRQRTQLSNALRAHLAEFGIVAPIGRNGIDQLLLVIADTSDDRVPADARICLEMLMAQLSIVKEQILENDRRIMARARETELGRRLMEIPGVGPLVASAIVATVPDPTVFRSGRDLSAWIGLVPRQNSSGGKERLGSISKAGHGYLRQMLIVGAKERLGSISKAGHGYLRQMLIVGAMAVVRYAERNGTKRPWLVQLLARRKAKVAAVALANKTARTIWAMMASGERYREPQVA
jgi:transposase